jgi:transposase
MCELLVGLPDVNVLGVEEGDVFTVVIETRDRPTCLGCGGRPRVKDRDPVSLVDLPVFGRPSRLLWRKHRWRCVNDECAMNTWTVNAPAIAASRLALTDRAGRWATLQVGRCGRAVSDVARELGCDWHTVNDAVQAYGAALLAEPGRVGEVKALGLDETLFVRRGERHHKNWSTSIVDVRRGVLLDMIEGRDAAASIRWLEAQPPEWLAGIEWGTLDLSGSYRLVFETILPHVGLIADPFHLIRVANQALDECRRRVQNETLGHRGRKDDPLYRCRRLLTKADESLDDDGRKRLLGLLEPAIRAVRFAWHGTRRRSCVRSTPTPIPPWQQSSLNGSDTICKTSRARSRSAELDGPCCDGRTRS